MCAVLRPVVVPLALSACAERALTPAERAITDSMLGRGIDVENVRIIDGSVSGLVRTEIPVRLRTTCRELIQRPRTKPVPGSYAAMAVGERVFYMRDVFRDDFRAAYPESMDLQHAMRLVHEMTHVW